MKIYNVELNNGVMMPILGLGVFRTIDSIQMNEAIFAALETGYRSFDTAQMYGNENILGDALKNSEVTRQQLFITSKINICNMDYDSATTSFYDSLKRLKTDYLDLILIHWCGQNKSRLLEVWSALEKLYSDGSVRAIGLSNATPKHINWILEEGRTVPAINQVEHNPLINDKNLFDFCMGNKIQLEAWGPLIRGNFDIPQIATLGEKYEKTPAQVILRWIIQSGYIAIPKSSNKLRIAENANIFDFALDIEDMVAIDSLNKNQRSAYDPEIFDF